MKSVKEALESLTEEDWLEIAKKATEDQNRKLDEWKSKENDKPIVETVQTQTET